LGRKGGWPEGKRGASYGSGLAWKGPGANWTLRGHNPLMGSRPPVGLLLPKEADFVPNSSSQGGVPGALKGRESNGTARWPCCHNRTENSWPPKAPGGVGGPPNLGGGGEGRRGGRNTFRRGPKLGPRKPPGRQGGMGGPTSPIQKDSRRTQSSGPGSFGAVCFSRPRWKRGGGDHWRMGRTWGISVGPRVRIHQKPLRPGRRKKNGAETTRGASPTGGGGGGRWRGKTKPCPSCDLRSLSSRKAGKKKNSGGGGYGMGKPGGQRKATRGTRVRKKGICLGGAGGRGGGRCAHNRVGGNPGSA